MTDKQSASRARALANVLRDKRRAAGLNTREASEKVGISPATLNRTELGTRMPPFSEVTALLTAYSVTGVAREEVLTLARTANPAGWWEIGGNALPRQLPILINFESEASKITEFQPLVVPGLLQTHAYIRAVMEASGVSDSDAEGRVSARAGRQTVLSRKKPLRYSVIMDEAALRRPFGGRKVMAEQIRHIIADAERPNVTVQVIPFDRGGYPIYGPFMLLQFHKALDIVHLEHKQASGFLDEPDDTAPFQALTDTLKAVALNPAATSEFLAAVAADYDKG
jgi:transcriptional regulator with XRE-family HTH domain